MAKRPKSQADDTTAAGRAPTRARRSRPVSPGAPEPPTPPIPSDTQAARAEATDERPIDLDPGPRPESLESVTSESAAATSMAEPSEHDIRTRAYHRYLERGGGDGMDFEDWLEAERDLKGRRG